MDVKDINLTPAELQAILEHQRAMSLAQGMEVSLETATEDFMKYCRENWLREKQHYDSAEQIHEIEKHKYLRSMEEKRDIGKTTAAEEWCAKYAHLWRAERESLERNGFLQAKLTLQSAKGLHIQPAATLAKMAKKYDCEVYLHHAKLIGFNFILQEKKYLNVKSLLGLVSVSAVMGDVLEIISTGPQAKDALEEIAMYINETFKRQDIEGVAGIES
ncbi:MAG: HPr family phosphocarrier protein [Kiritimatiellae bacterium]|nr:HPr family phosphocarrier protein [Kiritimatiellia bacterium]